MDIFRATREYETWLSGLLPIFQPDLRLKHRLMAEEGPFGFLRSTFYRWAKLWPQLCPQSATATPVLAVGDLHLENFGTWRDIEGRLVWGANDFDECYRLPWTNDLVRLATSAYLAMEEDKIALRPREASEALLEGYADGLKVGGKPFVLTRVNTPLRTMVRHRLEQPDKFWEKFARAKPERQKPPVEAARAIKELLPNPDIPLRFIHRSPGHGSLGRPRFTALGLWAGEPIARDAKAMAPSACAMRDGKAAPSRIRYAEILGAAVRCPDPFVRISSHWLVRRLSPECFRIELSDLPKKRDELALLYSMGFETANIHLGTRDGVALLKELNRQPRGWLHEDAKIMREQGMLDWKAWRKQCG